MFGNYSFSRIEDFGSWKSSFLTILDPTTRIESQDSLGSKDLLIDMIFFLYFFRAILKSIIIRNSQIYHSLTVTKRAHG